MSLIEAGRYELRFTLSPDLSVFVCRSRCSGRRLVGRNADEFKLYSTTMFHDKMAIFSTA
jgi:hypothetical protein